MRTVSPFSSIRGRRHRSPAVEGLESRTLLTYGLLDPSFGTAGTVQVPLGTNSGQLYSYFDPTSTVVGQYSLPDGKILEVINGAEPITLALGGVWYATVLQRLNPDGTPDTTFGPDGQVIETPSGGFPQSFNVTATAMQPDGKILLVGTTGTFRIGDTVQLFAERINPDGSLDATFHYAGPSGTFSRGYQSGIALAADGKIAIATSTPAEPQPGASRHPAYIQLNPDGSPDTTFGPNHDGVSVLDQFSSTVTYPFSSMIAYEGNQIVSVLNVPNPLDVIRLDTQGQLDPTFGTGGIYAYNGFDVSPNLLTVDPQGRIVMVGNNNFDTGTNQPVIERFAVSRLLPNGQPDATFGAAGGKGIAYVSFDSRVASATSVAFQPGGGIFLAGTVGAADGRFDLAIARLNVDGMLDPTYGVGGTSITATEIFPASLLTFDPQYRLLEARVGSDDQGNSLVVAHRFLTTDAAPPDVTPPYVTRFVVTVKHNHIVSMSLVFSEAMTPGTAGKKSSYRLVHNRRCRAVIRLRSARYDAATETVVLRPRSALAEKPFYQLTALTNDLTDLAGNHLAGQGNGVPGANYVVTFNGKTQKT